MCAYFSCFAFEYKCTHYSDQHTPRILQGLFNLLPLETCACSVLPLERNRPQFCHYLWHTNSFRWLLRCCLVNILDLALQVGHGGVVSVWSTTSLTWPYRWDRVEWSLKIRTVAACGTQLPLTPRSLKPAER